MLDVLRDLLRKLLECLDRLLATLRRGSTLSLASLSQETLEVGDRRFRVIKKIGEGGYAFVYLCYELPTPSSPLVEGGNFAIKKLVASTTDRLADARREIEVLQQLSHPHLLRLVDSSVSRSGSSGGGSGVHGSKDGGGSGGHGSKDVGGSFSCVVHMLFPAYEDGTLQEELDRLAAAGRRLPTRHVLDIFQQVCAGVAHMHAKGWAHRDLKPHNVLITLPEHNSPEAGTSMLEAADSAERGAGPRYEAVVMDFGSARQFPVVVNSRMEALALQEDAEANCTGTYRPPELFDVATGCVVDDRVDTWALGCTLFALMYGASPFQAALDQGASLALAVINCRLPWPKQRCYPAQLHELVTACLETDPARRPRVRDVLGRTRELQAKGLPDPAAAGPGLAALQQRRA